MEKKSPINIELFIVKINFFYLILVNRFTIFIKDFSNLEFSKFEIFTIISFN